MTRFSHLTRLLIVLVILAHERRRVVHVAVTDHPTAAWTAQQLREAFPWDEGPRFLVRDRDTVFNTWATTATAMDIQGIVNGRTLTVAERRRRTVDRIPYYERSRTHLSLDKDTPIPRAVAPSSDGRVIAIPQVGGLHYRYERRAA